MCRIERLGIRLGAETWLAGLGLGALCGNSGLCTVTVHRVTVPSIRVKPKRCVTLTHATDMGGKGDEVATFFIRKAIVGLLASVDRERAFATSIAGWAGAAPLLALVRAFQSKLGHHFFDFQPRL